MNYYEPPKWLKKQSKPFIELINKIPVNDTHAIIIEAANQAANLAFDQTYEVLIRLASGLPAQEEMIIANDTELEILLELKNIFLDCLFTSQQVIDYLKNHPQQLVWFEQKTGQSCQAARSIGAWLGRMAKNKKIKPIKIEKWGHTPTKAALWSIWSANNA